MNEEERVQPEVYYRLCELYKLAENGRADLNAKSQLGNLDKLLGPCSEFWLAFAQFADFYDEFRALIDAGLVREWHQTRTHDDWRRHFPEYRFDLTDHALEIISEPWKHVTPLDIKLRDDWQGPPTD